MTVVVESNLIFESERLLAARRLPEAIQCFLKAEAAGADADRCAAGRWMAYMLSGQFDSAWQESDTMRGRGSPDPNRFWQGESLAGKRLIVRCLHGFGDATQFLRYAPQLRAIASSLIVEVPPRFVDLAPFFDGVDEVITWGALAPPQLPVWDVQIEVMELPYLFRTQLNDLPLATRYLHLPTPPALKRTPSSHLRVGLAWDAGIWNPTRAVNPEALLPLLGIQGCEFHSLQGGPDCVQSTKSLPLALYGDALCKESIAGLAATISQLDLVITVDSLAAHLAGALGVNAWVLLQHEADWRWMHARSDSPWYPTLRLFRQPVPGDWASVVGDVGHALQVHVNSNEAAPR